MKTKIGSYLFVLSILLAVLFLPLLGSVFATGGFPQGYGTFPAGFVADPPGFNLSYFIAFSIFAGVVALFLLFPRLFGFAKTPKSPRIQRLPLPWWFWFSLPVAAISWFLMWARIPALNPIEHYAFVPLAWGFIGMLDGLVYSRNRGKSLVKTMPGIFKLMILISCLSWFLFEYLNFFVLSNWYYPNNTILSDFGNIVWFFLGYTTVLTGIFQWFSLLRTFPVMNQRYRQGPAIGFGKAIQIGILVVGLALAFLMGVWPYELFWAIWVSLIPALAAALALAGKTTLFSPIRQGNWTNTALIAIATLLNGIFWELWNFGSLWFHQGVSNAPGFWAYCVPYVDAFHLFSEMPLLGYWGYLFFGVNCWILWNASGYLLGFDENIEGLFPEAGEGA